MLKKAEQIKKLEKAIETLDNRINAMIQDNGCHKTRIVLTGRMFAYEACLEMIKHGRSLSIDVDGI